jgi:transposase
MEAQAGQRVVFFVDAAHFVFKAYLGFLWCFVRMVVRSPSGRKRFNVLGAFNAITQQLMTVTNETYINADSVCLLLQKVADLAYNVPITFILDNTRYQRCAKVIALAATLQIELLFLPPYSPNLNLIERVWRFVKKTCLYAHYYESYTSFKDSIETCLREADGKHKQDLATLCSLKFQSFKNIIL